MALKATIFKVDLSVADLDRNVYENYSLTLAQHPSENDARMMVRLQPDYTEIIAHEFEHVVEQLDQWQLRTMALAKGEAAGHVHEVAPEVFETERAIRIGQLVEAEVFAARRSRSTTTHEASAVVEHVTVTTHHAGS